MSNVFPEWRTIESAPKDGSRVLAYGSMVEGAPRIMWDPNKPRVNAHSIIHWVEGWYDKLEPAGDGLFKKVPTQGYAYWGSDAGPQQFEPTHWMPLPEQPKS